MSHCTNTILFDHLAEIIPRPLLRKLQQQGLTEWQIMERYTNRDPIIEDEYSPGYPLGGTAEPYEIENEKA